MKKLRDFTLDGQRMTFWDDYGALRIVGHTETNDRVFRKYMKKNLVIFFVFAGLAAVLIPINVEAFKYMIEFERNSNKGDFDSGVLLCSLLFAVQFAGFIFVPIVFSPANSVEPGVIDFFKTPFLLVSEKMRDKKYAELNYFSEFFDFLRDNYGDDAEKQLQEAMSKVSDKELGSLVAHIVKHVETVEKRSKIRDLMKTGQVDEILMDDLMAKEEELNGRADALMIEIDSFFESVQQMIDEETKQKVNVQAIELLAG